MIITNQELRSAIQDSPFVARAWLEASYYATMDEAYYVPDYEDLRTEVRRFVVRMDSLGLSYLRGRYDCNAYAYLMKAFAIVQAWQNGQERPPWPFAFIVAYNPSGHAFNACYVRRNDTPQWVWIEPQTGDIEPAVKCPWSDLRIFQI